MEEVFRSRFPRYLGEGDTCTLTINDVWLLPLELPLAFDANEDTTGNREAIVAALQECLLSISIHADIKLVSGNRSFKGLCYLIIFNEADAAECAELIPRFGFPNGEVLQAAEVVSQEEWCIDKSLKTHICMKLTHKLGAGKSRNSTRRMH